MAVVVCGGTMSTSFLKKALRVSVLVLAIIILLSACENNNKFIDDSPKNSAAEDKQSESGRNNDNINENKENTNETAGAEDTEETTGNEPGENNTDQTSEESSHSEKEADTIDKNVSLTCPVKVKALYLTGWTVGSDSRVNHYIELAKTTEINSYVIDIKDDDGYVGYESKIPEVCEINAWKKKYNVDKVLKAFHDNGVYIIGRLVCFKDPVLSSKRPDLAVKNVNGGLWRDNNKKTWLNPYNKDSWPYLIEIAKEAVAKGFDEIQFDYVRFPSDGNKKAMDFGNQDLKKYEIINEFLAYAKKELPNVILSADVFGIICESPADTENIGQYLELIGKDIEYISPMVYPSHYAAGQIVNNNKFLKPDLEPYGVVYNSLIKAKERISNVEGYKAKVRPYLQDFTASWLKEGYYQVYGPEQVRQQIKAVYEAGYDEWILWDADNSYNEAALEKEN